MRNAFNRTASLPTPYNHSYIEPEDCANDLEPGRVNAPLLRAQLLCSSACRKTVVTTLPAYRNMLALGQLHKLNGRACTQLAMAVNTNTAVTPGPAVTA